MLTSWDNGIHKRVQYISTRYLLQYGVPDLYIWAAVTYEKIICSGADKMKYFLYLVYVGRFPQRP